MNTFLDAKSNIKDKINEELLQDIEKSYPQSEKDYLQNFENSVDNFLDEKEKDTKLKNLYQSESKFDSLLEENFEKSTKEVHEDAVCEENEVKKITEVMNDTKQGE